MSDSESSESNETRRTVVVPSRQSRTSNRRIRTYTSVQRRDLRSIKAIIEHVTSMITPPSILETQSQDSTTNETQDTTVCCVCFNELENNSKHIETPCKHHYCNDCFFRWIRLNTSCAVCRRSFGTPANLSEEEIEVESRDVYEEYSRILYPYLTTIKNLYKAQNKCRIINEQYKMLMNGQISLKKLITYTQGYLIGYYEFAERDLKHPLSELKNYIKDNIGFIENSHDIYKNGYDMGVINSMDDLINHGKNYKNSLESNNEDESDKMSVDDEDI